MIDLPKFHWPNNTAGAVSLTYDDAFPCHFETAAPTLEAAGLRGTFNVIVGRAIFRDHVDEWKQVAARGQRIG